MDAKKVTPYVSVIVIVGIGVAYLVFLTFTWSQLQRDRSQRYARIDEALDRLPKTNNDDSGNARPDN